jgi:hypothetical protein
MINQDAGSTHHPYNMSPGYRMFALTKTIERARAMHECLSCRGRYGIARDTWMRVCRRSCMKAYEIIVNILAHVTKLTNKNTSLLK